MLRRKQNLTAIILVLVMVMVFSITALAADEPYFKVELGLFDRLVCLALLPAEGSFATLKIIRELQMELAPTEIESKLTGLKDDLLTGGVSATLGWDKVEPKEIEFGEIGKSIVVKALKELNDAEKLQQQHFNLYNWFVMNEKQELIE